MMGRQRFGRSGPRNRGPYMAWFTVREVRRSCSCDDVGCASQYIRHHARTTVITDTLGKCYDNILERALLDAYRLEDCDFSSKQWLFTYGVPEIRERVPFVQGKFTLGRGELAILEEDSGEFYSILHQVVTDEINERISSVIRAQNDDEIRYKLVSAQLHARQQNRSAMKQYIRGEIDYRVLHAGFMKHSFTGAHLDEAVADVPVVR